MKKRKSIVTAAIIVVLAASTVLASLVFTGCAKQTESTSSNKVVIATTFSAYDWARNVAKDVPGIEVRYLVDSAVDLHSYQPSAEDILQYKMADLVLAIGGESEEWIEDLELKDEVVVPLMNYVDGKEEELVEGMESEEGEGEEEPEYDEHIWLSLKNASICTDAIADEFSKLLPEHKNEFAENADVYKQELGVLDLEYEEVVKNSTIKTLLFGDRFPFRYMVEDYTGLNYYAAFLGCSAETEASFETIVFLSNKMDELKLSCVCTIGGNAGIAEQIIANTKSKDQRIVKFDSLQSVTKTQAESRTYIDTMRENLESLKDALSGEEKTSTADILRRKSYK